MSCPFLVFSLSNYLIQIVDINSHTEWQTVQIQISWLLQKPTDLDLLHCLQRQDISGFSRTRVNEALLINSIYDMEKWEKMSIVFYCHKTPYNGSDSKNKICKFICVFLCKQHFHTAMRSEYCEYKNIGLLQVFRCVTSLVYEFHSDSSWHMTNSGACIIASDKIPFYAPPPPTQACGRQEWGI